MIRYGDPINPYGDIESIARAHCMLKKDGVLFIGFPVGRDLVSTLHRIYGKYRLQLILHMWDIQDLINNRLLLNQSLGNHFNQPVWVLRKQNDNHITPD